jgi:hypothetical protein
MRLTNLRAGVDRSPFAPAAEGVNSQAMIAHRKDRQSRVRGMVPAGRPGFCRVAPANLLRRGFFPSLSPAGVRIPMGEGNLGSSCGRRGTLLRGAPMAGGC